jgi:hypothetical protein
MTNELNERLAGAVGIRYFKPDWSTLKHWHLPNGDVIFDLTTSMDACIKWIEPQIQGFITMDRANKDRKWLVEIAVTSGKLPYRGMDKSMPLAFCLAADKYFKGVSK